MATKAATFAAKIRNLQESCNRIASGAFPQPSATDVIATLKFFSQALLSVLRDVPSMPLDVIRSPTKDHHRISLFPSLDYTGLYNTLVQLLECLPQLQSGVQTVGQTLLHTLSCLVPFLEHEYMDTLPYIVASSLAVLPSALHKDLLDMLCYTLLPSTIMDRIGFDNQNFTNISVPAIMMMVFFYTDTSSYYTQLIETLMKMKKDVIKDLFCVIAHGTVKARCPAVELLFQYWPELNSSPLDRKFLAEKHVPWTPQSCQHENCASSMSKEALKMCVDHSVAIGAGDRPPPLLVCIECADHIHKSKGDQSTLIDILQPLDEISYTCVSKSCKSSIAQKIAVSTCFSGDCVTSNCHKPVRYCALCDQLKHSTPEGSRHVVHRTVSSPWRMDSETQSYFVEAIVNLLKEAQPISEKPGKDATIPASQSSSKLAGTYALLTDESNGNMALEERQLLSRYGVWLIISLCTPNDDTPDEVLGRLLSMLFQWFHYTAFLPDDQAGSALERLKGECIQGWLMKVMKSHFHIFSNCLLPHPADYAKVGGHWDCWPSQTNEIKEGFKQLLCLVPYDIITADVWSYIMPYWMECFRHEVPEEELAELKILLSKVLDPDLSPLGLEPKQMYEFISIRFQNTTSQVQEQALYWIQILTMLEVPVPLKLLLSMFDSGLKSLSTSDRQTVPFACIHKVTTHPLALIGADSSNKLKVTSSDPSACLLIPSGDSSGLTVNSSQNSSINEEKLNLSCYILMLDILIKQMELQDVSAHKGLENSDAMQVLRLLLNTLKAPWHGEHTCEQIEDFSHLNELQDSQPIQCSYCEVIAIWYQLALIMMEYFCPLMEATMIDIAYESCKENAGNSTSFYGDFFPTGLADRASEFHGSNMHVNGGMAINDLARQSEANNGGVRTAIIEECEMNNELSTDLHSEAISTSRVSPSALEESDSVFVSCQYRSSSAKVMDSQNKAMPETCNIIDHKEGGLFWFTSQGKFRIEFEKLPTQLQLLHILLEQIGQQSDADVLYHIMYILKLMALHSEVLNKAAREHRGYLIWCQENLLIPNLWSLLQAEFSQISQLCVPLLMHCVTLSAGREMFLKMVDSDFHDSDWRKRFTAVERVTTIAHFLEASMVKNSPSLQTSLTNAFCYLVHCLDDIESAVAQRALLNLESIKTASLKLLVWCLESQFDMVVPDRPIILQTIFQLYNHLSDRRFLTWDFFLNRFDALFLEAQIILERMGDISYTRDLKNTNVNSEVYQKKMTRAQEALSHVHLSRSLSISLAGKMPNVRAMASMDSKLSLARQQLQFGRQYPRQFPTPSMVRRKSSKFTGAAAIPDKFRHLPNNFFTDNQLREIAQEESHIMHVVHRIVESEEQDRDTMHSLIFLLMQFLSRPDHSHPQEEKAIARNQQIVLRHINILLGFSCSEKKFLVSAANLRGFPVFNAVIASMAKVLDFNFKMGTMLLSTFLPLLIYSPSHYKDAPDLNKKPTYSLWLLQPHVRQSWLMSVMIIMYKYTYKNPPLSKHIESLIQIVMNTLESQFHRCRAPRSHLSPLPTRSRDISTASIELVDQVEQETDLSLKAEGAQLLEAGESSGEVSEEEAETEPELAVILESPKSENSSGIARLLKGESSKVSIISEAKESLPTLSEKMASDEYRISMENEASNTSLSPKMNSPEELSDLTRSPQEVQLESEETPLYEVYKEDENKNQEDNDLESEPSVSESKEYEITIDASPSRPASITEKLTSEERRRTKSGIKKVLKAFSGEVKEEEEEMNQAVPKKLVKPSKSTGTWAFTPNTSSEMTTILPQKPPPPERLLPVGISTSSRQKYYDSNHRHRDFSAQRVATLPDRLPMPPTERLLPIGPQPSYKSQFTMRNTVFAGMEDEDAEDWRSTKEMRKSEGQASSPMVCDEAASSETSLRDRKQAMLFDQGLEQSKEQVKKPLSTSVAAAEGQAPKDGLERVDLRGSNTFEGEMIEKSPPRAHCKSLQHRDLEDSSKLASSAIWSHDEGKLDGDRKQTQKPEGGFRRAPPLQQVAKGSLDQSVSIDMPDDEVTEVKLSPTADVDSGVVGVSATVEETPTARPVYKPKRKRRPTGQVESGSSGVAASVQRRARKIESSNQQAAAITLKRSSTSQSSLIMSEEASAGEKCLNCGGTIEEFTEEEIGMCIVILGTYVHREPGLSAPILPEMLRLVAKFTLWVPYPWQHESPNIHLPGCSATIAQQFFRCTLLQLSSNGIFQQIFNSHFTDSEFFKAMAISLTEFMEMNQVTPLVNLFQHFNEKKHLPPKSQLLHILSNAAHYMECVSLEAVSQQAWNAFLPVFENFLRKMALVLFSSGEVCELPCVIRMILITLKLSVINNHRTLLDIYSKFVSHAIQQSPLEYEQLLEICHHSGRIFSKDRDRFLLTRTIVFELIQAIKFKNFVPDENLMMLVQFVLQGLEGTLVPSVVTEHLKLNSDPKIDQYNTNASECIKQYVNDITEFISDVHTISRVKSTFLGTCIHLNEETIGGHLKAGLSQVLALEITKSNGRDHRAVIKYLPWLYSLPSVQQGPKEFLDCVAHIRILSWILLGSLQHSALMSQQNNKFSLSQPIPLEANGHIAEHIQVILAGFAEQSKTSVIHMSSLFHAFILCQLWTMYGENISAQNPPGSEQYQQCTLTLSDFWAKVTPGILQLVCHSKVREETSQLAEMVSLHLLSLMEALMECNSNILARLLPMWVPVFRSYEGQLSGHLKVRFQTCINWQPPLIRNDDADPYSYPQPNLRWLQKLQFKMGQIENQSSAAIQFYCM